MHKKKGKRLIYEKDIQYLVTTVYYLIVSFVHGISYLSWGTVVCGGKPTPNPCHGTRVPLRATVEGIITKLLRTDQSKAWKVGHAAR